jgi:hypothetical protein
MAPDPSDEIGEFDDEETIGMKRKKGQAAQAASSKQAKRAVCSCYLVLIHL